LVKEMFRPAELVERIRRLVHARPPVIITALDSTWCSQPGAATEAPKQPVGEGEGGRNERAWPGREWAVCPRRKQEISIDLLDRLSRSELRALWIQEFGEAPPATLGRDVLALGVASASKFAPDRRPIFARRMNRARRTAETDGLR
jgi:hypothetical protein